MNSFIKAIIAVMGATNAVFSFFTPLAIALILTNLLTLTEFQGTTLLIAAIISSIYRAIRIGFIK